MKYSIRSSLVLLGLLVSSMAVSSRFALADEFLKDTNTITSLTPEQAKKLAVEYKGRMPSLNGLTTLDAATAEALAGLKRGLSLKGLTTLDVATARELAEFKGGGLSLNGLTTLDAATAKAIAGFKGQSLDLSGLTSLDAEAAKALVGFKGSYLFLGLTTIDAETATSLAQFKGGGLFLGLTTLDVATAKALAEFKGGGLSLNGLTTLDAATAEAIATIDKWHGYLSSIVAFESPDSVEIAAALATRKGPLFLPNLKKISPTTLSALLQKEDVDIPPLDTLELIQEPDGSPTDDFVIPERFQLRQNQQRAEQGAK